MPKKLPNGKPRIFVPNFDKPYSDLKLLSKNEASLICKNWMSNILLSVRTNKGISNTIKCDDLHIITSINKLNFDDNNKLYFGWKPLCLQGFKEVLFIVSIELDIDNKIMNVENLVQSPFWDNEQIESIFLKKSLISQNNFTNATDISFDKLFNEYPRYKLAWETWLK